MLLPKLYIKAAHEVTPEFLSAHALKAVMVDLDDTLIASGCDDLDARCTTWVRTLRDAGIPLLILSNGERGRVAYWAEQLGVPGLSLVGKPFGAAFYRGLALLGSEAQHTAMIGDQLFTDILGANLAGLTTILVRPLSAGRLPHTRVARRLEKIILRGVRHGSSLYR